MTIQGEDSFVSVRWLLITSHHHGGGRLGLVRVMDVGWRRAEIERDFARLDGDDSLPAIAVDHTDAGR
jgi:hypothetical protein